MTDEKTICLCLIVKNEEKTFPRLIESCKEIIDYWVICDTGSTDDTMKVIKKELDGIPGEFFEEPFLDFGHNRTLLVERARDKADYLLLMDADMIVQVGKGFNKAILDAESYMIRYTGNIDFAQPLLVSGHKEWRYEGYTHEYITTKGKYTQGTCPLMIIHKADGGSRDDKYERDVELCKLEITNYPQRIRPHFYLAMSLQNLGRHKEAIEAYQERIKRGGWNEEIYYSLYQIGMSLYASEDKPSAILQFLEAYDARPTRFEALFMIGQIHREMKKYSIAKMFFEKMVKQPYPKNDILFIHKAQHDYLVDFELGICNYWLGDYKEAEKHSRKLFNRNDIDQSIIDQNKKNFTFIRNKIKHEKTGKNDIVYASMYTHGTSYEDEVEVLKASLAKHGLFHEIMGIRPQGSWVKNTQQKPTVILDIMHRTNKDVVWIDADAEILEYPSWLETVQGDISYYTIVSRGEMLTGTVFFRNNQKIWDFLKRWEQANKISNQPDAVVFQSIMATDKYLDKTPMPAEYVKIFDSHEMGDKKPVIIHNQASRRFKLEVNTGLSPDNLIFTLFNKAMNGQDTCAVIGNGPYSTDLSKEIDNSFVMRCNNFVIGEGYEKIGSRIDLNMSSMFHEILPIKKVDYPILACLPLSETLYQKYTDAKEMHKHWENNASTCMGLGNIVWTYSDGDDYAKLFSEVAAKIDAFPTVGMMAIATARKLGFKKIILTGFTFFTSPVSHYWKKERKTPSIHHDVKSEMQLVQFWIDNDDIEYVLDDTMKKTMFNYETAKHQPTQ